MKYLRDVVAFFVILMDVVHHQEVVMALQALVLLAELAVLFLELISLDKLRASRTLMIHHRSVVIPDKIKHMIGFFFSIFNEIWLMEIAMKTRSSYMM